MDTAPYIINELASVSRTYRMFRTLGLRHLIVVSRKHVVRLWC
jgi:chloride channel 7